MKCKECVHYELCRDLFCQVDVLTDDEKQCDYYEQKRPHGKWIRHVDDLFPEESTEECSVCHEEQRITGNDDNFCPNCGADMREGDENDK